MKLTPKQRVLKARPFAYSTTTSGGIVSIFPFPIHGYSNSIVNTDKGSKSAWSEAARRLNV